MTVLTEQQQVSSLHMTHRYKEEAGVNKLKKGYKRLPREVLPSLIGNVAQSALLTLLLSGFVAALLFAITATFKLDIIGAYIGTVLFTVICMGKLLQSATAWMRNDPYSPTVINKNQRGTVKKARVLAKQLGEHAVPVLTAAHINAIQMIEIRLIVAMGENTTNKEDIKLSPRDKERLIILLLEDIERETVLTNLIEYRGLTSMDDLEECLREIENDTILPVQNGWL